MTQFELETIAQRLSTWRVGPADRKAGRYVGSFFDRKRAGLKLIAQVEGNYGTYTVSIDASHDPPVTACSCYIGAGGGCHHVRALAQTFLDTPATFIPQETRARDQVQILDDLRLYLDGVSLTDLLAQLESAGLSHRRVTEVLGLPKKALHEAEEGEARNQLPDLLNALKLACLWLLEWQEPTTLTYAPLQTPEEDAQDFLEEIDGFVADCHDRQFYDEEEVWAYQEDHTDSYEPHIEAFDILDDLLSRTDRRYEAGEYAIAIEAWERLFEIIWGDTDTMFGFEEIDGFLRTDLEAAVRHYLDALGRTQPPEAFVARAWEVLPWSEYRLLLEVSTPEQEAALEKHLLAEMEELSGEGGYMPTTVALLRDLYQKQDRTADDLALCRRLCHRFPVFYKPLLQQAEAAGNWAGLEALVREALALHQTWKAGQWPYDVNPTDLNQALSRALERRGDPAAALEAVWESFRERPDFTGYRRLADLAARLGPERRAGTIQRIIAFLQEKAAAKPEWYGYGYEFPSQPLTLLAHILLAEGRHDEAYGLAQDQKGVTQTSLLDLMSRFYLTVAWGEAPRGQAVRRYLAQNDETGKFLRELAPVPLPEPERDSALQRADECQQGLCAYYIELRGRGNYAIAAEHAAIRRDICTCRGTLADFRAWYTSLLEEHRRLRALKDELQRRLGPA